MTKFSSGLWKFQNHEEGFEENNFIIDEWISRLADLGSSLEVIVQLKQTDILSLDRGDRGKSDEHMNWQDYPWIGNAKNMIW